MAALRDSRLAWHFVDEDARKTRLARCEEVARGRLLARRGAQGRRGVDGGIPGGRGLGRRAQDGGEARAARASEHSRGADARRRLVAQGEFLDKHALHGMGAARLPGLPARGEPRRGEVRAGLALLRRAGLLLRRASRRSIILHDMRGAPAARHEAARLPHGALPPHQPVPSGKFLLPL